MKKSNFVAMILGTTLRSRISYDIVMMVRCV